MPLVFWPKPFLDHTFEDYATQDLNPWFLYHARRSKKCNGGEEVNVGSMGSKQVVKATPSSRFYAKAGLTVNLAMELADYNTRNAVLPVKYTLYCGAFAEKALKLI
jgi:hypothetical protein